MSEDAYYTALLAGPVAPKRLFRRPLAEQEAMIPRLAKAIVAGLATHRVSPMSTTGEKTWIIRDKQIAGEWWMIDPHIEAAARRLIEMAQDVLSGRAEISAAAKVRIIDEWELNDRWTVIAGRDPASLAGRQKTTARQMERANAYAQRA